MIGSNDKLIGLAVECSYDEHGVPICGRSNCLQFDVIEKTCQIDDARGRAIDEDSVCRPKVAAQAVQLKSFRDKIATLGGHVHSLRTDNDSLTMQVRELSGVLSHQSDRPDYSTAPDDL